MFSLATSASGIRSLFCELQNELPLAAAENFTIEFMPQDSSSLGEIYVVPNFNFCDRIVSVSSSAKRVLAGSSILIRVHLSHPAAAFDVIKSVHSDAAVAVAFAGSKRRRSLGSAAASATLPASDTHGMAALARLIRIRAVLSCAPRTHLAYTVTPSASDDCVDIQGVVHVPSDAPLGSQVVLRSVSVAGCALPLKGVQLCMTVGFNHMPAPKGPVSAAAEAGNVPALLAALDAGGSTAEREWVSECYKEIA